MGNQRQLNFLSVLGGMDENECQMLQMVHDGRTDLYIQEEMNLSKESFKKIEDSMRKKLLLAVMNCVNSKMAASNPEV